MGDPANRAPIQHSNIHGNGEGMSGAVQLGGQGSVQKALIGPRVNEDSERFTMVFPQQKGTKRGVSKGSRKLSSLPTSVLTPTGEPVFFLKDKRTQHDQD